MDRRAVFFMISAVLCVVLTGATPADLRWVGNVMALGYVVLAAASWLDYASRRRNDR
jgi:hypothetical protein